MRNDSRPGRTSATILTAPYASSHETTLPTSLSDIRAHLTLACALTPSENLRQRCRSRNLPALPIIYGFDWWEVPAPEDVQRCSIVEWVSGKLREDMENDHDEVVWGRLQGTVKEDEHGPEADLGQEREYGNYFEDEYVILGKRDEDSDAWSLISSVDERSCS